jgi:ABC-type bacteriocin/lantibiotic exporter with double-glycine peptidase domain
MNYNHNILSLLTRIWAHVTKRQKFHLYLLVILMLFASFAEVASIGALVPFLAVLTNPEKVFKNTNADPFISFFKISDSSELLFPLTLIFIVIILISALFRFIMLWFQTNLCFNIGSHLSYKIYRNTLYQPYTSHITKNSSEVISGISTKANSIIMNAILPVLTIISSMLILILILFTLIFLNPFITLAAIFGFGIIYFIIILFSKKKLESYGIDISNESNNVIKALQEGLGGIRDVLIDGTQNTYCDLYKKADDKLRKAQAKIAIIGTAPRFGVESIGMILIAILAYNMSKDPSNLSTSIAMIGALALGAQRMLPLLQLTYLSWTSLTGAKSILNDSIELLEQTIPINTFNLSYQKISFENNIKLNNISFQYSNDLPFVLTNLNLEIKKGSKIGIIGGTGSGKSTFLDILMGLLTPTNGQFSVDDIVINEETIRSWQIRIAHVPQNIFLADTTIYENIAFGLPFNNIELEEVIIAAKKAQIHETILTLPLGYKTKVGERGIRLSGGQRQRIGIARSLYKKADVIVFDEATSALDNETENYVMSSIDNLDKDLTIIIVAHRLSTLKKCDKIIKIENGQIVKTGTYSEIIK